VIFPKIPPILPKKLPQKGSFWQKGLTFWGYGTSLIAFGSLGRLTSMVDVVRRQEGKSNRRKVMSKIVNMTVLFLGAIMIAFCLLVSHVSASCFNASQCDSAAASCSGSSHVFGSDGKRDCFRGTDSNGYGINPGRCLTTAEPCSSCTCSYSTWLATCRCS